jgi:putative transposase
MSQREYLRELTRVQLPTIWTIPDQMWQRIQPLLPPEKEPGAPGRPPLPFRKVMNAILFVLRTGCQWKALPGCYGSGSTAHRRFQQWVRRGIIDAIVGVMVEWYERCRGIDWEWQAADTKLLAAPLGGEATGPNPTDLGKSGTKRHLLVDGRGVPLAFHLSGANRHDLKGLSHLLKPEEGLHALRPEPTDREPQHLCIGTRLMMPRKRIFSWRSWATQGISSGGERTLCRASVSRFTRHAGGRWNARSRG